MSDARRNPELQRIQKVYAERAAKAGDADRVSAGDAAMVRGRVMQTRALLEAAGLVASQIRMLDIGCGRGERLDDWLAWGVPPERLFGVDLMPAFVSQAARHAPGAQLATAAANALPFAPASFDLVAQSMVFSSILGSDVRRASATEMMRVVRPDGVILWYDMRYPNPTNSAFRPIGLKELGGLFPGWRVNARAITLAPPISRIVAPISTSLCESLEQRLPLLRSHYLAILRR